MSQTHPYQDVVAHAWSDPTYKQRLKANPKAVLQEAGFDPAYQGEIKVLENDDNTFHLVLPQKPTVAALSDSELETVAGGIDFQGGRPGPIVYPYPAPYPYPYPYGGPVIIGDPNYTPGPTLLNGKWNF